MEKPSHTRLAYPWQQAVQANASLRVWDQRGLQPLYPWMSSRYVSVGSTRAYLMFYRQVPLAVGKMPLLIAPGTESMFQFSTLCLDTDFPDFDGFIAGIR